MPPVSSIREKWSARSARLSRWVARRHALSTLDGSRPGDDEKDDERDIGSLPVRAQGPNQSQRLDCIGVELDSTRSRLSNTCAVPSYDPLVEPIPEEGVPKTTLTSPAASKWKSIVQDILMPASVAVILGAICALVPPLKALFVSTPGGYHIPSAPDGRPPLAFIYDTTDTLGALTVPASLILLGCAFCGLEVSLL